MQSKAVIFDLDGTLLDTLEDLADAMNQTLKERGFATHPVEAYRYFVGNGVAKLVSRALPPDQRTDELLGDCLKIFLEEYHQNWSRKTGLYDGVPEMLDALAARQTPMAIFTNKPQDLAERCAQAFFPKWPFKAVFGQSEGRPMKPDPTVPRAIAEILSTPPPACLYLGDSDADMKTAVNANMFPVGALWGFRPEKELRASGALDVIRRPMDLLAFLKSTK